MEIETILFLVAGIVLGATNLFGLVDLSRWVK